MTKKKWLILLWVFVVSLCLLFFILYYFLALPGSAKPSRQSFPDEKEKLSQSIDSRVTAPEPSVIPDTPEFTDDAEHLAQRADSEGKEGAPNPTISEFPNDVEHLAMPMPNLVGMKLQAAKDLLITKGVTKITTVKKFDPSKPEGTVLGQTPAPGASVSPNNTEVTLTIAYAGVAVPDVRNKSLEDAIKTIKQANLHHWSVTELLLPNHPEKIVVSQTQFVYDKTSEVSLAISTKQKHNTFENISSNLTFTDHSDQMFADDAEHLHDSSDVSYAEMVVTPDFQDDAEHLSSYLEEENSKNALGYSIDTEQTNQTPKEERQ